MAVRWMLRVSRARSVRLDPESHGWEFRRPWEPPDPPPHASWLGQGVYLSREHPQLFMGTKVGGGGTGAGRDSPSEARLLSSKDRFPSICPAAFTERCRVQRTSRAEGPGTWPPNTREALTAAESGLWTDPSLPGVQWGWGEPWGMDQDLAGA